jgi:hypothetical protein
MPHDLPTKKNRTIAEILADAIKARDVLRECTNSLRFARSVETDARNRVNFLKREYDAALEEFKKDFESDIDWNPTKNNYQKIDEVG